MEVTLLPMQYPWYGVRTHKSHPTNVQEMRNHFVKIIEEESKKELTTYRIVSKGKSGRKDLFTVSKDIKIRKAIISTIVRRIT